LRQVIEGEGSPGLNQYPWAISITGKLNRFEFDQPAWFEATAQHHLDKRFTRLSGLARSGILVAMLGN
jgi:hypothetical protein